MPGRVVWAMSLLSLPLVLYMAVSTSAAAVRGSAHQPQPRLVVFEAFEASG